jgi:hypothetical protein
VIDVKEKIDFREQERRLDETETVSLGDLTKLSTWIGIFTGRKSFPAGAEVIDFQKRKLESAGRRKARQIAEGTGRYIADSVFGEKYGAKVFDKVYDINAYRVVKAATDNYLAGYSAVNFVPAKYGSKELTYKGRKVLGRHDGRTAHFVEDTETALGNVYESTLKKSGFTKDQFNWAVKEYIKTHENAEAVYQKYTLQDELPEDEHGKIQAYILKSLKYSASSGAQEIYKVGVIIDSLRSDEFGEKIRKHADPDIRFDLSRRYASA